MGRIAGLKPEVRVIPRTADCSELFIIEEGPAPISSIQYNKNIYPIIPEHLPNNRR
jgi:hypothetical protein